MTSAKRRGKTTIYDIALAAETSPSTVSIVLNGHATRHRISQDTTDRIVEIARQLEYKVNTKARALRLARSGLAGMIVANYRNGFFSGLVEAFENKSRLEGLCPLVASGQRDPRTEREVAAAMIRQQVEMIFFAGVTELAPLNALCRAEGIRCVNIDLPDDSAPSVVTDNHLGGEMLTRCILDRVAEAHVERPRLIFIGGHPGEYTTEERLRGFRAAAPPGPDGASCAILCGYDPKEARTALERFYGEHGALPHGVFVNAIATFEGVIQFLLQLNPSQYAKTAFGCFDWHPLAAPLPFVAGMIEQDVVGIVDAAFTLIADEESARHLIAKVPPQLIQNRAGSEAA